MKKTLVENLPLIAVLLISFLVLIPFVGGGLFETHDGVWVPVRLAEMIRELKDFQIPPRMSGYLNHGFGYPLFNFTYPFPYYLGTVLYLLRFGLVGSTNLLFALTVPFSALAMFFLAKEVWKTSFAGVISAILYVFLPYRIVDLFVRGSIGESIAFVLFPLTLFLALKNRPLLLAVSIAVLITTHNIMAVLFLPLLVILAISLQAKIVLPVVLGFGLSAYFWLPALIEKNNLVLSKIPIADRNLYFVKPLELIMPKWGYGLPTNPDGFGYQLGIPQILATLAATGLALVKRSRLPIVLMCLNCLMVFLMSHLSSPIWQLPFLKEINYPWTLLAPIGFLTSLQAGYLAKSKPTRIVAMFLCAAAILLCLPHARPLAKTSFPDEHYSSNDATTTSSNELMPLWVQKNPTERTENPKIKWKVNTSNKLIFETHLPTASKIVINKIDYPGWVWNIPHRRGESGLTEFSLSKGKHVVIGTFAETPLRQLANLITLTSVAVLLTLAISTLKRRNNPIAR